MVLSLRKPLITSTQIFAYPSTQEQLYRAKMNVTNSILKQNVKRVIGGIPYYPLFEPQKLYPSWRSFPGFFETLRFNGTAYRLILDDDVELSAQNFLHVKDRNAPRAKQHESHMRVVSFNLQNYFVSAAPMNGDLNPQCTTRYDANKPRGCNRGAKNKKNFTSKTKLVHALLQLDADVIGVTELENNGFGDKSAISFFVKST